MTGRQQLEGASSEASTGPSRGWLKVLVLAGVCVGSFLLHIALRTQTVSLGFRVGKQRSEIGKLEAELFSVKVKRNRLMGPESLEKMVNQGPNMFSEFIQPKADQLVYLQTEDPVESAR